MSPAQIATAEAAAPRRPAALAGFPWRGKTFTYQEAGRGRGISSASFHRAIKDEAREVAPGLYLGLAYFMLRGRARLVLYFGLQKR